MISFTSAGQLCGHSKTGDAMAVSIALYRDVGRDPLLLLIYDMSPAGPEVFRSDIDLIEETGISINAQQAKPAQPRQPYKSGQQIPIMCDLF